MKRIQAKKHKIGTYEIDKISLSCFDDKRFVLDNGVHTLAYFHKDCNKKCDKNENKIMMIIMIMIMIIIIIIVKIMKNENDNNNEE